MNANTKLVREPEYREAALRRLHARGEETAANFNGCVTFTEDGAFVEVTVFVTDVEAEAVRPCA
jgi:hypothetical protein